MHVVLTALGSYGDVHPMVGLGEALARRGHEVVVVTNPHFEGVVRTAGLGYCGVSTAEAYDTLTRRRDLWQPVRGLEVVFRFGVVEVLDELYERIAELHRPGETVIGAHGLDLASRVAAESLGANVASVVYAPLALWSDRSPPRLPYGFSRPAWLARLQFRLTELALKRHTVHGALNALRERTGLGRLREPYFDWYYRVAPPLCLFPDWFAANPGDWPDGTEITGFPLWDAATDDPLPADAEAFLGDGDPPIAFTPGSANRVAERFFRAPVGACERLGRRGVLLTKYPEQLPTNLPDSVKWLGFPPLGRVLRRCAAVVHHGGIGTSAQGLAAGVPQLIHPMGFDQPDNAVRLRRLGVGDQLKPSRFRAAAVAAKLERLLTSGEVAAATRRCAEACAAADPLAAACDALERRLATPSPNASPAPGR